MAPIDSRLGTDRAFVRGTRLYCGHPNTQLPRRFGPSIKLVFLFLVLVTRLAAQTSRKPDLSGLTAEERQSIQSACSYDKNINGPAAYHDCLRKQLDQFVGSADLGGSRRTPVATASIVEHPQSFSSTAGQETAASSPELQKLRYFLGTWEIEGEIKSSLFGPEGKFSGTHHNEWAPDRLSLISRWDESRPGGKDSGKAVYSYDPNQKLYTYHGTDSEGETEDSTGTVEGNTWIWISAPTLADEQTVNGRFTVREISSTSYSFKFEIAPQTGGWTTVTEGKATKTK